jgi:site-specific DNA-adenine methylase
MCGVIVICEEGPLKEYIPYQDYIIWTTNSDMIKTIRDVEERYDELHNKLFSINNLSNLLEIMKESNKHELYDKFMNVII